MIQKQISQRMSRRAAQTIIDSIRAIYPNSLCTISYADADCPNPPVRVIVQSIPLLLPHFIQSN